MNEAVEANGNLNNANRNTRVSKEEPQYYDVQQKEAQLTQKYRNMTPKKC
jgi:hypothetical protein